MKKIYKTIETENGKIVIYGGNRWIKIEYSRPRGEDSECKPYFRYGNRRYYLDEFMRMEKRRCFEEFDGYISDSFFSGVLIKWSDCGDAVKAYTSIS